MNSWGVRLVEIPLEELVRNIEEIRSSSCGVPVIEDFQEKAEFYAESSNDDILKSIQILQLFAVSTGSRNHGNVSSYFPETMQLRSTKQERPLFSVL